MRCIFPDVCRVHKKTNVAQIILLPVVIFLRLHTTDMLSSSDVVLVKMTDEIYRLYFRFFKGL